MVTIKSFTDLEQAKKLAEILPLESADMHYNNGSCRGVDYTEYFSAELMPYQEALGLMKIHKTNFMFQVIPCWSLAALLEVMKKPEMIRNSEGTWLIRVWYDNYPFSKGGYNNHVDACVAMIEELHELKLL